MTRKDYVLIAQAIKRAKDECLSDDTTGAVKQAARNVALSMERDNPRFDRARFMAACGFED